jgi:release factor glutamine methyltransferase
MPSETIGEAMAQLLNQTPAQNENFSQDLLVLMARVLGKEKTWVMAHTERVLSAEEHEKWEAALSTFRKGVPLPYVLGEWEFYGLRLKVTPAVLIPRPETELLVETGINWLNANPTRRRGLDVGTGSGCIPVALASNVLDLEMVATDISAEALDVAKFNVQKHGLTSRIRLLQANLMDGIAESFDLICGNLPYIPNERLPMLEVPKWEPLVALGGGLDGLQFIKPFLQQASAKLTPQGLVLAEIDAELENQVKELAKSIWPNARIEIRKDLAGLPRLLVAETI